MSISLTNFLVKLNNLIDDNLNGTTTSNGNVAKTTLIDVGLTKYDDGYFGDPDENSEWWVYTESQLRSIRKFVSATGTISVHKAFAALIATSKAYSIHRFDRDKKKVAINQALNDAYPYFYLRVDDETALDGTGAGDNEYEVPATFTEFPDQIWKKHTSGTAITYTPITDFVAKRLDDTWYFYADITTGDDILLIGKTYLTQFTDDASTTELTTGQADVVALLAASILYRNLSGLVNATDSERFDSLANRYLEMYERLKVNKIMPRILPENLDWSWTE